MLQVRQFINAIFSSNTFLLYKNDSSGCFLIDCGDILPVISWISKNQKYLQGIFLTHTHFDHIYGLNEVIKYFPEITVYTSIHGMRGMYSDKLNFSRYHEGDNFIYTGSDENKGASKIIILKEKDRIDLFPNCILEVLETPGHDRSCLSFRIDKYLFTGDSYIPGLKTITTFPHSNKEDARKSLSKILEQVTEHTIICPGHGEFYCNTRV